MTTPTTKEQRAQARQKRGAAKPKGAAKKAAATADAQPPHEPDEPAETGAGDEEPPSVMASVDSIEDAREKREKLDDARSEADEAFADMDIDPVEVEMDELDALKLENLDHRVKRHQRRIGDPLKAAYQAKLSGAIDQLQKAHQAALGKDLETACLADEEFKKASAAQVLAVNEAIAKYTEQLPEGHAVQILNPEDRKIVSKYDPDARGKTLAVPG